MRVLLLAAGMGIRLRPITNTVPKCLVSINGRPLLDHWLVLLSQAGITDILINLHYLPEQVYAYLATTRYPLNITTVYEPQLLGTGGTLLKNWAFFLDQPAMLVHADNLSLFDTQSFLQRFDTRASNIDITMMTFHTETPETCGVVELDNHGTVIAFHEKVKSPPCHLANAAVYIISPTVINFIKALNKEIIDFSTDVIPYFMGRINTFHNDIYHRDIGTPSSLEQAKTEYSLYFNYHKNISKPPGKIA